MKILKCLDVCKTYGQSHQMVKALNHVNLEAEEGEFLAVTGPSGSGKSTLLYCLGTLEKPTSGSVFIGGQDLGALNQAQAAVFRRRHLGIVYQFYNLIPDLTIQKNIELPVRLDHRQPDPDYMQQLVKTLGLEDILDRYPSQISGGQQQRAAIARALLGKPAVVLADEPTGNLDQKNRREIMDLLKMCNRQFHQTIVLVTHDEQAALQADRVVEIVDGKLYEQKQS